MSENNTACHHFGINRHLTQLHVLLCRLTAIVNFFDKSNADLKILKFWFWFGEKTNQVILNSYVSFLFKPCFAMMYHYFITHCCRRDIIITINHFQSQVSVNNSFMIWWNVQVQCGNLFQVESYNLFYTISPIQRYIALLFGVETHVCIMVLVWETCWVYMLHFTIFLVYKLS